MKRPRAWFLTALLGAALGCDGPNVSSGDRVLVDKSRYETGIKEPQRFDVVVFKFPKGPLENNTPKNYIKRLLGLPGEIIAIFFGRLFHFAPPAGTPPPFDDHKNPDINPKTLWSMKHDNHAISQKLFEDGQFKIVRKTPNVMLALRRIVYDNNFPAKDMDAYPRWAPAKESAWKRDKLNALSHDGAANDNVDWLRYRHLMRPAEGPVPGNLELKPQLITDMMSYNSIWLDGRTTEPYANWVGDLMLECRVDALKGEGEFWIELSKGINRMQARWDLATGVCTLFKVEYKVGDNNVLEQVQRVELDSKPTKLRGPGNYQVRFANFDARLTVWVDRELPFGDGKDYPPAEVKNGTEDKDLDSVTLQRRRGPTRNDLEPASVGVQGAAVQVGHIKLWRDTYYSLTPGADVGQSGEEFLSDPTKWDPYRKMEYRTLYVQPGHFLCLGDNSQASSDGREWGLVPERLMLGRALLVYYPFHRAGAIR